MACKHSYCIYRPAKLPDFKAYPKRSFGLAFAKKRLWIGWTALNDGAIFY